MRSGLVRYVRHEVGGRLHRGKDRRSNVFKVDDLNGEPGSWLGMELELASGSGLLVGLRVDDP